MKKEEFKEFVKNNPKLITFVKNNEMTWQKFYEMYDLYGADNKVWDKYIKEEVIEKKEEVVKSVASGFTLSEFINSLG